MNRVLRLAALVLAGFALSGGCPSRAPVASSELDVRFQRIQRTVPPLLFGQNLQSIEHGEGIVRADGRLDPDVIELLSEARITSLRFPGGTAADFFHWWQALGPHSRRARQSTGYLGDAEFYKPVVGPDEFIRMSVALRAVPFVTANSGSGSAEEAGAFARFFESRGFPVTFWEVGNEIYFEGVFPGSFSGLSPEAYANKVIEYAAAIREESPHARIFAAGVIGPEESDSYWNAVVLGVAGPYIDGLSVHNAYYPLLGYTPDGTVPSDPDYLYEAMLGATAAVERTLDVLEAQLQRLGRLVPIFVSEYDGIFYPDETVESPDVTVARNPTLASALFNASVLHILMRHEMVHGAHHMSLAGHRFGSLIGREGDVVFRNPQFYVHREYAREAGNLLVESTLTPGDATFDSGPIKLLGPQTDVPMIDAVATRDPAGERYALFVINRSLTHDVSLTVSSDLPAGLEGTRSELDAYSHASRNTAANPDWVRMRTTTTSGASSFVTRIPMASLVVFRWSRSDG